MLLRCGRCCPALPVSYTSLESILVARPQDYAALQRFEGYVQNDPDSIAAIRSVSCFPVVPG